MNNINDQLDAIITILLIFESAQHVSGNLLPIFRSVRLWLQQYGVLSNVVVGWRSRVRRRRLCVRCEGSCCLMQCHIPDDSSFQCYVKSHTVHSYSYICRFLLLTLFVCLFSWNVQFKWQFKWREFNRWGRLQNGRTGAEAVASISPASRNVVQWLWGGMVNIGNSMNSSSSSSFRRAPGS